MNTDTQLIIDVNPEDPSIDQDPISYMFLIEMEGVVPATEEAYE